MDQHRLPSTPAQGGFLRRPPLWHPPIDLSTAEQAIIKRMRRAKLLVFLRQHRHELFCDPVQQELAALYTDRPPGQPPVPPAPLALATMLQASSGVSDDDVIEATPMDRRWQVVRDCLDSETPPFSKATLVAFRPRLSAQQMDRRLLERPVALAATSGACGSRQWRAALDRSPLWGAGRVEDTYTLLGHALRTALGVIARQQGRGLTERASEVGTALVTGSSVQAALALDGDDPGARQQALTLSLAPRTTGAHWLACQPAQAEGTLQVAPRLAVAYQVQTQAIPLAPDGTPTWRQGGAADRRLSVEDAELRHGRKSQSLRVAGSKRHGLRDLDSRLIVAVGVTPAHVPEASVTDARETALAAQQSPLQALHIDRASRASKLVQQRADELPIFCKAWPVRQGPYFSKSACHLDWERHVLQCPGGETMPFAPGEVGKLPAATCARCPLRERCTTSASGRSVTLHPEEALVQELRERQQTPQGRAKRRERVAVEHALAHVGRWQGRRARYRGVRKNVFDLRRCAVVHTLHVLLRLPQPAGQAA